MNIDSNLKKSFELSIYQKDHLFHYVIDLNRLMIDWQSHFTLVFKYVQM